MKEKYFNRIRELRKENGYTIEEMGEILGISGATYSRHEKDGNFPTRKLIMLADLYDVTLDYIFGFSEQKDEYRTDFTIDV